MNWAQMSKQNLNLWLKSRNNKEILSTILLNRISHLALERVSKFHHPKLQFENATNTLLYHPTHSTILIYLPESGRHVTSRSQGLSQRTEGETLGTRLMSWSLTINFQIKQAFEAAAHAFPCGGKLEMCNHFQGITI
jgi:hypothetical protein